MSVTSFLVLQSMMGESKVFLGFKLNKQMMVSLYTNPNMQMYSMQIRLDFVKP